MTPEIIAKIKAEIAEWRAKQMEAVKYGTSHNIAVSTSYLLALEWVLSLANPQEPTDDR